jgi:hypothetical protein
MIRPAIAPAPPLKSDVSLSYLLHPKNIQLFVLVMTSQDEMDIVAIQGVRPYEIEDTMASDNDERPSHDLGVFNDNGIDET